MQGERAASVYFVQEGLMLLCGSDSEGEERLASLRGPNALLCYEALGERLSPVEVRALGPARLCALPVFQLEEWLGPGNSPARILVRLLMEELARRDEDLACRSGDALGRVARLLAACSEETDYLSRVPQQLIARTLGIRPETFSRCLRRFADEGVLTLRPIRVLCSERLLAFAEPGR
jgi:CRP-like cAMP-binding protein